MSKKEEDNVFGHTPPESLATPQSFLALSTHELAPGLRAAQGNPYTQFVWSPEVVPPERPLGVFPGGQQRLITRFSGPRFWLGND
jgi:hypothetical protein